MIRAAAATVACLLILVPAFASPARAAGPGSVAAHQDLVKLFRAHPVHKRPVGGTEPVTSVAERRPITGVRTVLPVLARTVDNHARPWLRVRLPGRALAATPPPRTGWIRPSGTRSSSTAWHVVVDVSRRRALIFRDGIRRRWFPVIVGASSTPTPVGRYFVEENVLLNGGQAGAPYALATSARSPVLQEFAGGPGQIALHGLGGVGGQLGTAVSHGCVRLSNAAVAWLAKRIRPGAPLTIRR